MGGGGGSFLGCMHARVTNCDKIQESSPGMEHLASTRDQLPAQANQCKMHAESNLCYILCL